MLTFVWRHMWRSRTRTLALIFGVAIAVASFTLLIGNVERSRLDVIGEVRNAPRLPYDILIRPAGSRTPTELAEGTVRAGFLSDQFGGITLDQLAAVRDITGVEIAAPVAMLGIVAPRMYAIVDLSEYAPGEERSMFALTARRSWNNGLSTMIESGPSYVFFTPDKFEMMSKWRPQGSIQTGHHWTFEVDESGTRTPVCDPELTEKTLSKSPFDASGDLQCYSLTDNDSVLGFGSEVEYDHDLTELDGRVAFELPFSVPMLIAAVDPAAERAMSGLDDALVSGEYLGPTDLDPGGIPVIMSSDATADLTASVRIERFPTSIADALVETRDAAAFASLVDRTGEFVGTAELSSDDAFDSLASATPDEPISTVIDRYWTSAPLNYSTLDDILSPRVTEPADGTWTGFYDRRSGGAAPASSGDTAFRTLTPHVFDPNSTGAPTPHLVTSGRFDPALLDGYGGARDTLNLFDYPRLTGADEASAALLDGQGLAPSGSPTAYVQQPPAMFTDIDHIDSFFKGFGRASNDRAAPLSAIRVRVAGVDGIDELSRERIRVVAETIRQHTGLDVDVTLGSSFTPKTVLLPAGEFGRPELRLTELWVKKGVAVTIVEAVDYKSVALYSLILVVCVLFVANTAAASVRARRTEFALLSGIGWRRKTLFATVSAELVAAGLLAGLIGFAAAYAFGRAGPVPIPAERALFVIPSAGLLCLLAGLHAAHSAAHVEPLAALHPAIRRGRRPGRVTGSARLAVVNVFRMPGRAAAGVAALAVGTAATVLLTGVSLGFDGVLVGSVLGDAVAVSVRGSDIIATTVMLALAVVVVADIGYLNTRDRATEFAVLRAVGWSETAVVRLVIGEAGVLGVVGACAGAATGLLATAALTSWPVTAGLLLYALPVMGTTIGLAMLAVLAPLMMMRRLDTATRLAEE